MAWLVSHLGLLLVLVAFESEYYLAEEGRGKKQAFESSQVK